MRAASKPRGPPLQIHCLSCTQRAKRWRRHLFARLTESRTLHSAAEPQPVVATALWAVSAFRPRGGWSVVRAASPESRADGPQGRGYNRNFGSALELGKGIFAKKQEIERQWY